MTFLEYLGFAADSIAIAGIPIAIYQIYKGRMEVKENHEQREVEEARRNEPISITLLEREKPRKITLPNTIRRGVLTRGEVMGRLGMIPRVPELSDKSEKHERFKIKFTTTAEFNERIDQLFVSTGSELIVNCESSEIDQFNSAEMQKLGFVLRGFR